MSDNDDEVVENPVNDAEQSSSSASADQPEPQDSVFDGVEAAAGAEGGGSLVKKVIDTFLILYCIIVILVAWGSHEEADASQMVYCQLDIPLEMTCDTKQCDPGFLARKSYSMSAADMTAAADWIVNGTTVLAANASEAELVIANPNGDKSCHQISRSFKPLSDNMKFALSMIPFIMVFQGILSFNLSSRYVAPTALLVVSFVGLGLMRDTKHFARDELPAAAGKVLLEIVDRLMWTIFDYAANVFTAFFLLRVLQIWGVVEALRIEFESLAPGTNGRIALVGFSFAIMLAVVAPGGSNFVIAGAILIKMNLTELPDGDPARLLSNKKIGALCLFGNALTSAFNLLGVCVNVLAEDLVDNEMTAYKDTEGLVLPADFQLDTREAEREIGRLFASMFTIFSTGAPLVMCLVFSDKPSIGGKLGDVAPDGVMLFMVGFSYSVVQLVVAAYIGRELPCMLGGLAGMLSFVAYNKLTGRSPARAEGEVNPKGHWLPFVLLLTILLFMNMIPAVEPFVKGDGTAAASYLNIAVWKVKEGGVSFKRNFAPIWHSAVITGLVALLTPFICELKPVADDNHETLVANGMGDNSFAEARDLNADAYRQRMVRAKMRLMLTVPTPMASPQGGEIAVSKPIPTTMEQRWQCLSTAFTDSAEEVLPVIVSITSFASLAKLMGRFEMTQAIAIKIVDSLSSVPALYSVCIPIIATLGSGLTGSTTTSNFLFGRLQVNTAKRLGLIAPQGCLYGAAKIAGSGAVACTRNSIFEVGAAQMFGATAGEIISPMNAVVITLMDGVGPPEGAIIALVTPLALGWMTLCMVVSAIFIVPEGGFIN